MKKELIFYLRLLEILSTLFLIYHIRKINLIKLKNIKVRLNGLLFFFAFLHTFGRDLKWNPHIHVLIAELKISGDKISKWNYFDYDALSKRFQKILLDLLSKRLDKNIFSNELKKELFLKS